VVEIEVSCKIIVVMGFGGDEVIYDIAAEGGVEVHNFKLISKEVNEEGYNAVGKGRNIPWVKVLVGADVRDASRFVPVGDMHGKAFRGWRWGIVRGDPCFLKEKKSGRCRGFNKGNN